VSAGRRPPPPWIAFDGDVSAVPRGAAVLLSLHDWRSHRSQWRAHAARVGVTLGATDDSALLLAGLDDLDAVLVGEGALTDRATSFLRAALAQRGWGGSWLVAAPAPAPADAVAAGGPTAAIEAGSIPPPAPASPIPPPAPASRQPRPTPLAA
jgi:hypothetical protein